MGGRALGLLALALPAAAGAQSLPDTARYGETTQSVVRIEVPDGPVVIRGLHDGVLAVRFVTPDSMEAWYESLDVASEGPAGTVRPSSESFLGDRFVLRYGPGGHVETLATPDFPEETAQVTDLRLQFHDFFPHRPERTLMVGMAWTDTLVSVSRDDGSESRSEGVADYRVVSDSVVDGAPHLVVHSTVRLRFEGSGPVQEQPGLAVSTSLGGVEENVFLVRLRDGRLVSRTRSAELRGDMAYMGMRAPVSFPVTRSYESRIEMRTEREVPEPPGPRITGRPRPAP